MSRVPDVSDDPGTPGGQPATFQSCLAAAVRGPERFLGRVCSYGACLYLLAELSRRRSKAYSVSGDNSHKGYCPTSGTRLQTSDVPLPDPDPARAPAGTRDPSAGSAADSRLSCG